MTVEREREQYKSVSLQPMRKGDEMKPKLHDDTKALSDLEMFWSLELEKGISAFLILSWGNEHNLKDGTDETVK